MGVMEYKDVYILAEEANTYDTPNRSIEAGIFTDAFIKGYKKANEWISINTVLPPYNMVVLVLKNTGSIFISSRQVCDAYGRDLKDFTIKGVTHWQFLPPKP